jgi:hypothetical protein
MAERPDPGLASMVNELLHVIAPLEALCSEESVLVLLGNLGWEVPRDDSTLLNALGNAFSQVAGIVTGTQDAVTDLLSSGDPSKLPGIISKIKAVYDSVVQVKNSLTADNTDFLAQSGITDDGELFVRLVDYLIVAHLRRYRPRLHALLLVAGLIERTSYGDSPPAYHTREGYVHIRWEQIPAMLTRPFDHLATAYRWGTDNPDDPALGFDDRAFFANLLTLMSVFGMPGGKYLATDNVEELRYPIYKEGLWEDTAYTEFGVALRALDGDPGTPLKRGLALAPYVMGGAQETFDLSPNWQIQLQAALTSPQGLRLAFRPGRTPELEQGANPAGHLALKLLQQNADISLLGSPDGPYMLRLRGAAASVDLKTDAADWLTIEAELQELLLRVMPSVVDGFLQQLLPRDGLNLTFGFGLAVSNTGTLHIKGSGGLDFNCLINATLLDALSIPSVQFAIRASETSLQGLVTATLVARLGPLAATVEGIGLTAALLFPKEHGPEVTIGFKPPTGIGLAVSGGGFEGGGFLSFDPDNGRYVGILELAYQHTIALKAIGLLNTRLPGGGFSLLIIISGEFPPIQLGYGFTLNGAGGLLGLNRSLNLDVLAEGIKSGALDAILFPQDPVANASQIIGDLEAIFPTQPDQFVFGPMARIGWGVPTLITIDLGLVLEVPAPARLAILGALRCRLPSEDKEILRLQVGFVGAIDFAAQELSFDSSIYDSRLLTMTLSGDMAFRLRWGSDACFLLSVGGFHPAYQPPTDLAHMSRITVNILGSDNPRLKLEGYFAITSNTVQFGAKVELYASACGCKIHGFLGFDVLLQFSPFHFIAEIRAGVSVSVWGCTLMSVFLKGALSGPTPWNAKGEASFKILFVRFSVYFNETFGESVDTTFPDEDVWPLLKDALLASGNWRAELPGRREPLVTLKTLPDDPERLIVHPFGILSVSQRVVPLGLTISRFGNKRPAGQNRFSIEMVQIGDETGPEMALTEVRDEFARAQFVDMSDEERLALPAFEKLKSGVRFQASEALMPDKGVMSKVEVDYEDSVTDVTENGASVTWDAEGHKLPPSDFDGMVAGGSAAGSGLSIMNDLQSPLGPANLYLYDDTYRVVNMADMQPFNGDLFGQVFPSYAEAASALSTVLAQHPDLNNTVQVVPACEML